MKILVAEDNRQKVQRIVDLLVNRCGLNREAVEVVGTIQDARSALRSRSYDLFILDVVLPIRPEDEPSHKGAVEILEELAVRNTLQRPARIIGLTAYDEAFREAGPHFAKRVWTLIRYSFDSDEWANQIGNCVAYIRARSEEPRQPSFKTDLCIVTALPAVEMEAISRIPWKWTAPEPIDDTTFIKRGRFQCGDQEYTAIAAVTSRMGMVASALLGAKLIEYARPRYLINAGICGGVAQKTNYGDIILGDPCWDWQNGKHVVGVKGPRLAVAPDQLPVANFVRVRADQLRSDVRLWSDVRSGWPTPPDTELKLRIGPMASGSAVLADEQLLDVITQQQRNLLAVEMEAYGVYAAASEASFPRPTAFALKSVCDFANGDKDDTWQAYAAYTSAAAVRVFFERYMHEIYNIAGSS